MDEPITEPLEIVPTTIPSVVTIDDNSWAAIWRPKTRFPDLDHQAVARILTWIGAITTVYAGVVLAAWAVGLRPSGAPAFLLVVLGIGLILANLVGAFAVMAMADRRPTSLNHMEQLLATQQAVGPEDPPLDR